MAHAFLPYVGNIVAKKINIAKQILQRVENYDLAARYSENEGSEALLPEP